MAYPFDVIHKVAAYLDHQYFISGLGVLSAISTSSPHSQGQGVETVIVLAEKPMGHIFLSFAQDTLHTTMNYQTKVQSVTNCVPKGISAVSILLGSSMH